eukprot:CAMPEP_0119378684 /NCGR_PEP_ID=MMETSP1334-20130426/49377_1 /TAXON_ID=127549 /ORGANISM="Calcidiscus leptoporus, Strain RCC1130" /LENGTH=262 /DNA_ID=CAMNT_0007397967 /DNA_START=13 /DNA_END=801 /DNA_ORIENTATION=-
MSAEASWPPPPPFYRKRRRTPPSPVVGEFTMYGVARTSDPPPPSAPDRPRYDLNAPRCAELRRLNAALFSEFMALTREMARSPLPAGLESRVEELHSLFLSLQHLLNSFRPQQARAEVADITRRQIDAKRKLITELNEACLAAVEVEDSGEGENGWDGGDGGGGDGGGGKRGEGEGTAGAVPKDVQIGAHFSETTAGPTHTTAGPAHASVAAENAPFALSPVAPSADALLHTLRALDAIPFRARATTDVCTECDGGKKSNSN